MNTKLTLRLDDQLIGSAKRFSVRSGKSVSQLVADYFSLLDVQPDDAVDAITPRVRAMIGTLRGAEVTELDYRQHLDLKYR